MRIQILAVAALSSMIFATPAACGQTNDGSRSTRRAITQSQAIAADFLRTELALSPETASRLNLEDELGPMATFRLDNHSQAGFERKRLVRIELLQRLRHRPRLPDGHALNRDLAVAETALLDLISLEQLGYGRFDYQDPRPYALDPFSGIWIEGPTLLAFRQSINSVDDASAFIARLQSLSAAVSDTKRRLIADRAAGLEMPRPLAEETHRRLQRLLVEDATALDLLSTTFTDLTLDLNDLDAEQREQLLILVDTELTEHLRPALNDLATTVARMAGEASDQAGVWAQPMGQDLFLGILKASTGEPMITERMHTRHLTDVEALASALRQSLIVPVEDGAPVPERPNTLTLLLPWFESQVTIPTEDVVEGEAPVAEIMESLAPTAVWSEIMGNAAFDAQARAVATYRDLWSTQPYLTWRTEGDGELPAYRILTEYPAIDAAWRLYVWTRSEAGAETPPLEQAAQQSILLIQTALAAVDTGLHLDRWSKDEARDYLVEQTGLSETIAETLVLRIMARPGYHTSVMAAYYRLETLSERARAVLGERYSETDFQRTLIQPGPRPLDLIEVDVEAWYGARLAN